MPIINAAALEAGNLKGVDHGATISLILDHSEPGQGPRLHRHPYDETWVVRTETSRSSLEKSVSESAPATS